jgi:TonB-linked SusC/RagA family outer membrane protein
LFGYLRNYYEVCIMTNSNKINMRSKFKWIFTLLVAFSMQFSFAQEKTITGIVSDVSGPLPGANVLVKGTTKGVSTGFDGGYSIKVKVGETLVYSFLGLSDVTRVVGTESVLNVKMQENKNELDVVVVTSQGIKKQQKTLGYAVTTLQNEDFASKPSTDVARALTGKAAGVNIQQTSGLSGSGTNIIIRGYSSISGSNQPLFVVDGVPFNTDTNNDRGFQNGATTASSRFLDLDPNSIESISILKGLSATTLYGNAGRNGVVLVTTKSSNTKQGSKKLEINLTNSYFINQISSLPDYQDNYGNGFYQNYSGAFSNWGPNFNTRGTDGIGADGTIPHWYSDAGSFPNFPEYRGVRVAYKPYDNVKPFFKDGNVATTSVNVSGNEKNTSYNVNFGHTDDQGFIENNSYKRVNFGVGGRTVLSNGFTFSSSFNYSRIDKVSPPTAAAFGSNPNAGAASVFANILYTPRSYDLINLPFQDPVTNKSVYYRNDIQNPRWTLANAEEKENVRRFFGNVTAAYKLNSWSDISYRVSIDGYNQKQTFFVNKGGPQDPDGGLFTSIRDNTIWDHTFTYNTKFDISNSFDFESNLGLNPRQESRDFNFISSRKQFVYNNRNQSNFEQQTAGSFFYNTNTVGLYGAMTLGYNKYLYLTLQGRNDWFSSLQPQNRSIFYPSGSLSFIVSDAITALKDSGNYLKLRAGYGTSAGFPDAYATTVGLVSSTNQFINPFGANIVNTIGNSTQLGNLNLKPELHKELEFGIEAKLFNNRIGLDLSVYDKKSSDLILQTKQLDPATGYSFTASNVAEVSNKGIEIGFNAVILKPKTDRGFNWNTTINFTQNKNIVESLGSDSKQEVIAGFTNQGNFAVPGKPYGVIYGSTIKRDGNGNYVVGTDGNYIIDSEAKEIGDPNAKFRSTLINEFSFRGFTFQFQLEYQDGGDMYSTTARALIGRGLTKDTDFDRSQVFVLPGVLENGSVNNIQIPATQYYFLNAGFGADEVNIYDATNLRLREISLSYTIPKKFIEKTPFGNISISLVGQNLWFKAFNFPKYLNFDPEVSSLGVGNGQGFDYLTGPTSKRIGFNLRLTF